MIEILFRGKTISGEWVEGNYSHIRQAINMAAEPGHYISNSAGVPFAYQVVPSTIGMFTGLHDRDGNRIFEGDIGISRRDDRTFIIVFENGGFHGRRIEDNPHGTVFHFTQYDAVQFTITGNIHES